ncbi:MULTISPECIES: hypothetical protein [unclassified Bradyrhizobium]|uniref:hypothetical protein n=1 Tax=unclassified Bradyrhizobium TaxID=2631580 RepID=UPI001CD75E48|nr:MULTISPECIES: hypothetical protein [unclassified Bradyrhizobium]MCA1386021.1 hypothetical protein [Bradyrhizobium sp. BRP05]MCA1393819.1 hypothetical protein [Bradyrhizobium sp. IC3123]MCA1423463.1 hypothetical protein [Bradyrhizobium sp. BRP23]MCA1430643.1 hypothetical protein [Bradyrhizobium sp. NBAIM16]MCA1480155.1 hypothetical protein [Bradyrhizobium sp. NBAIM08]
MPHLTPVIGRWQVVITGRGLQCLRTRGPRQAIRYLLGGAQSGAKQIASNDLIGQPTWIQAPSIAFKTVMRADLKIGDEIRMPKTLITNSQQTMSSLIYQSAAQQGTFLLSSMHHLGNDRQLDG